MTTIKTIGALVLAWLAVMVAWNTAVELAER